MPSASLLAIAVGLSMDAFAVSVNSGVAVKRIRLRDALVVGLLFGLFQGGMSFSGWYAGHLASDFVAAIDHWIAFLLLAAVGGHMLYQSAGGTEVTPCVNPINFCILLALSIATSIDAFAVGISLAFLTDSILDPIAVIALTTFLLSMGGIYLGRVFRRLDERVFEIIGGIFLIIIGIKILVEHLYF